jgi:hypothetical protein
MSNIPLGKPCPLFQPLIRPLSGVHHMVLLQRGEKRVLLIGEEHESLHYGSLGFVPISRIIHDYLQNVTEKLDFMFEIKDVHKRHNSEKSRIRYQKAIASHENENSGITVLNQLRYVLQDYVTKEKSFPNARVHYLDKMVFKDAWLNELVTSVTDKRNVYESAVSISTAYPLVALMLATVTARDKTEGILDIILNSWPFTKCRKRHNAMLPLSEYVVVFKKSLEFVQSNDPHQSPLKSYVFALARFVMDMYTTCRILHKEEKWYHNIVVYAGALHTMNTAMLLNRAGFTMHKYDAPWGAIK